MIKEVNSGKQDNLLVHVIIQHIVKNSHFIPKPEYPQGGEQLAKQQWGFKKATKSKGS